MSPSGAPPQEGKARMTSTHNSSNVVLYVLPEEVQVVLYMPGGMDSTSPQQQQAYLAALYNVQVVGAGGGQCHLSLQG